MPRRDLCGTFSPSWRYWLSHSVPPVDDTQIADLAHRNLGDFVRFIGRLQGGPLLDVDGVVATGGGPDHPAARQIVRSNPSLSPEAWAVRVDEFVAENGRSACCMARAGADDELVAPLEASGFHLWSNSPEMVCPAALEPREPPDGVTVRFATSEDDARAYARIAGEAFGHLQIAPKITLATLERTDVLLADDCIISLAEVDGEPVAGALVTLFGPKPIAYVSWVSCADSARGRGLGDTVTRAVTNEAFARGAQLCTLEASSFGEHTYARMGYREIYRYNTLIRM
jgi:ribosomal protein S18 acetylase RimI-like enzyme